ncbi:MAG: hypothetical protein ABSB35_22655 [Bryobacteraceae bacterium]
MQTADDDMPSSPEDSKTAHANSFRSVLHEYYSSQSGSESGSDDSADGKNDKNDKNDKRTADPSDQSQILTVPVQPADKPRDVLPLIWALTFLRDNTTTKDTPDRGVSGQTALPASPVPSNVTPSDPLADSEDQSIDEQPINEQPAPLPKIDLPPDAPSTDAQSGPIAFAARLTPTENAPATDVTQKAAPTTQQPTPRPAEQPAATPAEPADKSGTETLAEQFSKTEATPSVLPVSSNQAPAPSPLRNEVAPANPPATGRIEHVIDPPATPPSASHDITVRVPDATERGMDVRFVERAGEVRVSVRTGDGELAQTLRSGLNDFVGRLEQGGIRAEVWRPGSDASSSQSDSQDQPADQRGSGRNQSGTQDREEQQTRGRKPAWVEELEQSFSVGTTGKE